MKKMLIFIGFLGSLHGAEQNIRAPNLWPSIQVRWSYAIAAFGAATAYVCYKSISQYRKDVFELREMHNKNHGALLRAMGPYFYAYHKSDRFKNSLDYIIEMAASDSDVVALLSTESKNSAVTGISTKYVYGEYLRKKIFTQKNMEDVKYEVSDAGYLQGLSNGYLQPSDKYEFKDERAEGSKLLYSCVINDKKSEDEIDPKVFFQSSLFLKSPSCDHYGEVDFKILIKTSSEKGIAGVEAPLENNNVHLNYFKMAGFVKSASVKDSQKILAVGLESAVLMKINREYIKRLYVNAGGTLYEPQQKDAAFLCYVWYSYAWYCPVLWLHKLFGN